jgi:HEAT repeat protein
MKTTAPGRSLTPARAIAAAMLLAAATAPGTGSAAAQQPRITNGKVVSQPAGATLAQTFRSLVAAQSDVAWIAYAAPVADSERMMCCFGGDNTWVDGGVVIPEKGACCRACRLEPAADGTSMARRAAAKPGEGPVRLHGSERMVVLYRVVAKEIERVRVFSEDCDLDAGGRTVVWLENVQPADSVALLESLTAAPTPARIADGAITAIALHGDPAADAALERLVAPTQSEAIRRKVTFWLGNARGARGLALLKRVLADDPSVEVQKSAVFGVSQSREAGTFDTLADLARTAANSRIRGEALFWIAQKDDARAGRIINDAIEKDTSAEVRKKAVFALSQLKNDAGVDALVRVARTGPDPATRGEAIFWLGQKAGRKAAAAITERIEQDPDTEVKKRAVFALSQMPKDEGIPLLINVARTHTNPAVRKQAMFWLGQSKDPRAIDFFAEILK